jgi:hypothetical protein
VREKSSLARANFWRAIIWDSSDRNTAYHDCVTVITATTRSPPHRAGGCGMVRTIDKEKRDDDQR